MPRLHEGGPGIRSGLSGLESKHGRNPVGLGQPEHAVSDACQAEHQPRRVDIQRHAAPPAAGPDRFDYGNAAGARLSAQFASAGRLPPVDLSVREDLRTRLGWGPVHAVQPLAEADTRDALRQEAGRRGVVLGDDVLDYILVRFARDLKSLMHLLHRLDGFALAEKRAITVPLLKRMLNEEQSEQSAAG